MAVQRQPDSSSALRPNQASGGFLGSSSSGDSCFVPKTAARGHAQFCRIELSADAHQVRNGLSKKPAEAWGQPERLVCHASRLVCAAEPIVGSSQKENGLAVAWMLLDKLREAARSKLPFLLAEGKECQIELSFRPGRVRFEGTRATPSWPQRHPRRQRRMRRGSPERHRSEAALKRSERLVCILFQMIRVHTHHELCLREFRRIRRNLQKSLI